MRHALTRLAAIAALSAGGTALAAGDSDLQMPPPPAPRPMATAPATTSTTTTTTSTTTAPSSTAAATSSEPMKTLRSDGTELSTREGWNTEWAMLFSINNVLQNGAILSAPITGSIGGTYFLTDQTMVRAGINLSRQMTPTSVTKTVTTAGDQTVTTYVLNAPTANNPNWAGGPTTENDGIALRADYLLRMFKTPLSPYYGGGLSAGLIYQRLKYVDDVSTVDARTEVDNQRYNWDITARGIIGAEWRFHPNFAIYAEYGITLSLIQGFTNNQRITSESTAGGVTSTSQTTVAQQSVSFLQLNTGLNQGANLGLIVFF